MDFEAKVKHTKTGLERFVFFSDAVVAIAITLLVLPLVDSARQMGSAATATFFVKNAFQLLAAGVTFAAIGSSWRIHHRLFEQATGYSRVLVRVNFLWLAVVVFFPVATELLVVSPRSDRLATGLYIGTIALLMALLRAEEFILRRSQLMSEEARLTHTEEAARWIPVILRLLALLIGVVVPGVGLWALVVVLPEGGIEYAVARHSRRTTTRVTAG